MDGRGEDDAGAGEATQRSLSQKLDYLFRNVHARNRGEFSYREVAAGIERVGGPAISPTYLMYLRKGERTNPTLQHLDGIAQFFGVPSTYFLDDAVTQQVAGELELLAAMRDAGVRSVALRLADLSPEGLAAVRKLVEDLSKAEAGESPSEGEGPPRSD